MGFNEFLALASLVLGVLNLVIIGITAAAVIYYAAKTRELVLMGERDYEPNVVAEIRTPEAEERTWKGGEITGTEKVRILAYCDGPDIAIPISYTNLSKGISEFRMTVSPWVETPDGEKISLSAGVKQGLYNGGTRHIMRESERRETTFILNFGTRSIQDEMLDNLEGCTNSDLNVPKLIEKYGWVFHIQIFIDYLNERTRIAARYYDHYRSAPWAIARGRYVGGFWIFEGRSETPFISL